MKKTAKHWKESIKDDLNVNLEKLDYNLDMFKHLYKKKLGRTHTFESDPHTAPESVKLEDFNTPAAILEGLIDQE